MTFDLKAYARLGAEARLSELQREMDAILAAFPDLRTGARRPGGRLGTTVVAAVSATDGAGRAAARLKRKPMTAAQRRAVGVRMKKYWAERRKKQAKA